MGQALAEFALVFPLFILVLFSIIVLGLYVFYNQQLETASREAARYAAVHSASAQCPTVSHKEPAMAPPLSYFRCDAPENGWPRMVGVGRSHVWGMNPASVTIVACWSGFVTPSGAHDALPEAPNQFVDCRIRGTDGSLQNPQTASSGISCPPPSLPSSSNYEDTASSTAYANSVHYPTRVTIYACFNWTPPMAGFVLIPAQITLRSVITELLQRQQ